MNELVIATGKLMSRPRRGIRWTAIETLPGDTDQSVDSPLCERVRAMRVETGNLLIAIMSKEDFNADGIRECFQK